MRERDRVLLLLLILSVNLACGPNSLQPTNVQSGGTNQNQDAGSEIVDIKRQWEAECKKLDPIKLSKDYPGKKLDILVGLLEKASESQTASELARIRAEAAAPETLSDYDETLLQALFLIYAKQRNREKLVQLFSLRAPRFVATSPIELEVASLKMPQPLLIIFDSYDAAVDANSKRRLLEILRASFRESSEKYPNDGEFIRNSRVWYTENSSGLEANPYYHQFAPSSDQRDLFVSKPQPTRS